jgi:hypothetical protein
VPIPAEFLVVVGFLAGLTAVLLSAAGACGAVTLLRRAVRHCRISWRREGWGGRGHPNQDITYDPPVHPMVEAAKGALPARGHAPQLPEAPGDGADRASPEDSPTADTDLRSAR